MVLLGDALQDDRAKFELFSIILRFLKETEAGSGEPKFQDLTPRPPNVGLSSSSPPRTAPRLRRVRLSNGWTAVGRAGGPAACLLFAGKDQIVGTVTLRAYRVVGLHCPRLCRRTPGTLVALQAERINVFSRKNAVGENFVVFVPHVLFARSVAFTAPNARRTMLRTGYLVFDVHVAQITAAQGI